MKSEKNVNIMVISKRKKLKNINEIEKIINEIRGMANEKIEKIKELRIKNIRKWKNERN